MYSLNVLRYGLVAYLKRYAWCRSMDCSHMWVQTHQGSVTSHHWNLLSLSDHWWLSPYGWSQWGISQTGASWDLISSFCQWSFEVFLFPFPNGSSSFTTIREEDVMIKTKLPTVHPLISNIHPWSLSDGLYQSVIDFYLILSSSRVEITRFRLDSFSFVLALIIRVTGLTPMRSWVLK